MSFTSEGSCLLFYGQMRGVHNTLEFVCPVPIEWNRMPRARLNVYLCDIPVFLMIKIG